MAWMGGVDVRRWDPDLLYCVIVGCGPTAAVNYTTLLASIPRSRNSRSMVCRSSPLAMPLQSTPRLLTRFATRGGSRIGRWIGIGQSTNEIWLGVRDDFRNWLVTAA